MISMQMVHDRRYDFVLLGEGTNDNHDHDSSSL